ncbi:MAG: DUF6036 family nucleotidyltransferase [Myxococcota bacterium]|nr:DUF6036 family nucleotidyltransferase [Myxococcota bacterium]
MIITVARILAELDCRWYLFGAQAVNLYARPRLSADVDVTVELDASLLTTMIDKMQAQRFDVPVPVEERAAFIAETRVLPFVHRESGLGVDLVLAGPGLESLFFQRLRFVPLEDMQIPVLCPEDLVVSKILAARPKDLDDAANILRALRASLRVDMIEALLAELEEALGQSDLLPLLHQLLDPSRK